MLLGAAALSSAAGLLAIGSVPGALAAPPPGRAYELVSPADDPGGVPAGVATDATVMPAIASRSGDRVVYGATASIGATTGGTMNPLIFGSRTDRGWVAETGARSADNGNTPFQYLGGDARLAWVSDDADGMSFLTGGGSLGAPNPLPNNAFSIYGVRYGGLTPSFWLSQPAAGITPALVVHDLYSSSDLRTTIFSGQVPLTADAPPSGTRAVYMARDGVTTLVSREPGTNAPFATNTYVANVGATASGVTIPPAHAYRNALSSDGRYLLLSATAGGLGSSALYVRDLVAGTTTVLAPVATPALALNAGGWNPASPAQSIGAETVQPGSAFAASDAPVAYFRSVHNLAPGATGSDSKIYRADLTNGNLTLANGVDGPPVAVSPDGEELLFLRPTGTGVPSTGGQWELRSWSADDPGTSQLLGSIPGTNNATQTALVRQVRFSPSTRTWVFTASGSLDPHPDRQNQKVTAQQLYRWSVDGGQAPRCLSCHTTDNQARFRGVTLGSSDALPAESLRSPPTGLTSTLRRYVISQPARSMSDDGSVIAFDSPDRLVPEDQNDVRDVYLWDAASDQLYLLTNGDAANTSPSFALDVSADGGNVFFTTRDAFVAADNDSAYDVYTARVGDGIPEDPDLSCVGEGCRPAVIPPIVPTNVGSGQVLPPSSGNEKPAQPGTPALRVRSVRTAATRLTVRVTTPGAGRLRVSGSRVRSTSRSAKRQTTYTLRVPLSASTKRSVARGRAVKVSLRVSFTPQGSNKATVVRSSVTVRKGR